MSKRLLFLSALILLELSTLIGQVQFAPAAPLVSAQRVDFAIQADINNDGLQDIVFTRYNTSVLAYLLNDEDPNLAFQQQVDIEYQFEMLDLVVLDINNDGADDLLYVSTEPKSLVYLLNDGNGTLIKHVLVSESEFLVGLPQVADYNNDGFLDIAIGRLQGFNTIIDCFLNTQEGGFSAPIQSNLNIAHSAPRHAGDVDQDGDIDLITVEAIGSRIDYLINNGSGMFIEKDVFLETNGHFTDITASDLDLDGDIDFAVMEDREFETITDLVVYTNLGEGNYNKQVILSDVHFFIVYDNVIVLEDIDGDGDEDVTILNSAGNPTSFLFGYFINEGPSSFSPFKTFTQHSSDYLLSEERTHFYLDRDGDSDLDFIFSNEDEVYWIENMPGAPVASFNLSECDNFIHNISTSFFPNSSIEWDFGNGETSSEAQPFWPYNFEDDVGEYNVSLTICLDGFCDTATDSVTISHKIDFDIPSTGISSEEIFFTDSSIGFTNWTWVFGDGNVSLDQSPTHIYESPGTYKVELFITDANELNCTRHFTEIIEIEGISGVESLALNALNISPNPLSDYCLIETPIHSNWHLTLNNINGRTLKSASFSGEQYILETGNFAPGLYVLTASNASGQVLRTKLLITK